MPYSFIVALAKSMTLPDGLFSRKVSFWHKADARLGRRNVG
jgi:hypothetical protein